MFFFGRQGFHNLYCVFLSLFVPHLSFFWEPRGGSASLLRNFLRIFTDIVGQITQTGGSGLETQ